MGEPRVVHTVSRRTFERLLEYSCSLPTGTALGKRWRRKVPYIDRPGVTPRWFLGEYVRWPQHRLPRRCDVGIRWQRLEVADGRALEVDGS